MTKSSAAAVKISRRRVRAMKRKAVCDVTSSYSIFMQDLQGNSSLHTHCRNLQYK